MTGAVPVQVPELTVSTSPAACAEPVIAGTTVLAGSLGLNTESVFAAIVVQPDCWPAYLSPIVVPVSGTSMVCVVVMWT